MFSEKCEISKCHNFLISYPIFIIFAPICREIFILSFEFMVILDWTSPLRSFPYSFHLLSVKKRYIDLGRGNICRTLLTNSAKSISKEACHSDTSFLFQRVKYPLK